MVLVPPLHDDGVRQLLFELLQKAAPLAGRSKEGEGDGRSGEDSPSHGLQRRIFINFAGVLGRSSGSTTTWSSSSSYCWVRRTTPWWFCCFAEASAFLSRLFTTDARAGRRFGSASTRFALLSAYWIAGTAAGRYFAFSRGSATIVAAVVGGGFSRGSATKYIIYCHAIDVSLVPKPQLCFV